MMLAFRSTWYIKAGMMGMAVDLLLAEMKRTQAVMEVKGFEHKGQGRVYSPMHSPHALILETSFESQADHDAFWAHYDEDSAEAQKFWKQWYELVRDKGPVEVWQVAP